MKNSISFDAQHRLSYCYPYNGGTHTGVSLLTPASLIHYAFDNNGSNSSLNITDGFSGYEKYVALKTQRPAAGIFYPGNDVSSMISSGPYQLNPGDTLVLAWAVMAGNHLADLQSSVVAAREKYFNTGTGIQEEQKSKYELVAVPNPTTAKVTVDVYSDEKQNAVFTFSDLSGRILFPSSVVMLNPGMNSIEFDLMHYPAGLYNLSVTRSGISTNCRISVIRTQ
jgi:serine protease